MADVQYQPGYVYVPLDLWLAITQSGFTTLEHRALDAVMFLTYGAGKTKAEMTVEDIRYILGASDKLRTDRLEAALQRLLARNVIFRQELVNGNQLLGVQTDSTKWLDDKMSDLITKSNKYININTLRSRADKMSTPERLLAYMLERSNFRYTEPKYKAELKQAKRLYLEVITKTVSGADAFNLICDYIEENEWMRQNVAMPFSYMASRFEAWRSQIPRKPREIRENEEALGKRYRYDTRLKQWVMTGPRREEP